MNQEMLTVFEYLEKDKGISREALIEAIESSLLSASKKSIGPARDLKVSIDPKTGEIQAFCALLVVEKVADSYGEIDLEDARRLQSDVKIGDEVVKEVTPKNFGRIAAQTAKQVVIQKIREAEKQVIFEVFQDRVGDLANGIIRRIEKGQLYVDLGKAEGAMPPREQPPHEDYRLGMRLRAYILDVQDWQKGSIILLSRTHPSFVRKLFEVEVPEIDEGVVKIKAIAREPGYRTKLAVWSENSKVDSVGACVGIRGSRVKSVVRELNGEKIDIVRWSDDPVEFIKNSLSPAKLKQVTLNPKKNEAEVVVDEDQLSLAIGRKGQNVRLSSRLTGWKIDIFREGEILKGVKNAVSVLTTIPGVGEKLARSMVEAGFTDLAGIAIAEPDDLTQFAGVGPKKSADMIKQAREITREENQKKKIPEADESL